MRPIDADALIGKLRKWGVPSNAWVIDEIKQAQTIDAEPVIHCKDCAYYNGLLFTECPMSNMPVYDIDEDFCSRAQRKDE